MLLDEPGNSVLVALLDLCFVCLKAIKMIGAIVQQFQNVQTSGVLVVQQLVVGALLCVTVLTMLVQQELSGKTRLRVNFMSSSQFFRYFSTFYWFKFA